MDARALPVSESVPDVHLDLGCGKRPRNPYHRARLCGVDIRAVGDGAGADFEFRAANVTLDPIPYPDAQFGSVSAFDFVEHVPRILPTPDGRGTCFPFIRLMNEVWRVLAPGGRFYALTPAYPHPEAFQDPTHVNIITERTHEYFCGENPLGRMYGFHGEFIARRTGWVRLEDSFDALTSAATVRDTPLEPPAPRTKRIARTVRDTLR
jgi:SAM-dependent methyltransferase